MIYFLRANGLDMVKIGYTRDSDSLQSRIQTLQTGVPWKLELLRVIEGEQALEGVLHQFFSDRRHNGEWFTYSPDMMAVFFDGPKAILKRHLAAQSRKDIENMIERLVDILDEWTPDPEAEPEIDAEPGEDTEEDAAEQAITMSRFDRTADNLRFWCDEDYEPAFEPVPDWELTE